MSSYSKIRDIPFPPNVIRDFFQSYPKTASFKVDLYQEHLVMGLDIFCHNKGAASLTLAIDGQTLTVEAGDTFSWDNIKFAFVEVTSTVAYDLILAGKRLK